MLLKEQARLLQMARPSGWQGNDAAVCVCVQLNSGKNVVLRMVEAGSRLCRCSLGKGTHKDPRWDQQHCRAANDNAHTGKHNPNLMLPTEREHIDALCLTLLQRVHLLQRGQVREGAVPSSLLQRLHLRTAIIAR